MQSIKVTLVKSTCKLTPRQKATIRGLGLKKIGHSSTLENTPSVRGMIKKVIQFVSFEE